MDAQMDEIGVKSLGIVLLTGFFTGMVLALQSAVQLETFGAVDSVKTASDLYSPLSGEVIDINEALKGSPELVNTEPYGAGWMLKVKPSDLKELDSLLDAAGYEQFLSTLDH